MAAALGGRDGRRRRPRSLSWRWRGRGSSFHGARGPLHTSPSRGQSGPTPSGRIGKQRDAEAGCPGPNWYGVGGGVLQKKTTDLLAGPESLFLPRGHRCPASVVMRDSAKGPTPVGVSRIQLRPLGERRQHSRPGRSPSRTHVTPAPLRCTFTSEEAQEVRNLPRGTQHSTGGAWSRGPNPGGSRGPALSAQPAPGLSGELASLEKREEGLSEAHGHPQPPAQAALVPERAGRRRRAPLPLWVKGWAGVHLTWGGGCSDGA